MSVMAINSYACAVCEKISNALKKSFMSGYEPSKKPLLKYRESNYTLAELERRLNVEVNGFKNRSW